MVKKIGPSHLLSIFPSNRRTNSPRDNVRALICRPSEIITGILQSRFLFHNPSQQSEQCRKQENHGELEQQTSLYQCRRRYDKRFESIEYQFARNCGKQHRKKNRHFLFQEYEKSHNRQQLWQHTDEFGENRHPCHKHRQQRQQNRKQKTIAFVLNQKHTRHQTKEHGIKLVKRENYRVRQCGYQTYGSQQERINQHRTHNRF